MSEIGLDYLDLYLVHAPWAWNEVGKDCREENRQIWKAMEEFLASGRGQGHWGIELCSR
jgi:diketogulonate reductase-like aldo/keto reductase